jgi:hypothetical protein
MTETAWTCQRGNEPWSDIPSWFQKPLCCLAPWFSPLCYTRSTERSMQYPHAWISTLTWPTGFMRIALWYWGLCTTSAKVQSGNSMPGGSGSGDIWREQHEIQTATQKYYVKVYRGRLQLVPVRSSGGISCKDTSVSNVSRTTVARKHCRIGKLVKRHDISCSASNTHILQTLPARHTRGQTSPQASAQVFHPFVRVSKTDMASVKSHLVLGARSGQGRVMAELLESGSLVCWCARIVKLCDYPREH